MTRSRTVLTRYFTALTAGLLASCGGGYGGNGGNRPPASLTISVDPTTITLGESAIVTWSSNAGGCTASGAWSGSKPSSGDETVTPTATGTFTYSLVCSGGGYSASVQGSATLTVEPAALAGVWNGDACCVDAGEIRVTGLTDAAGAYRFLLPGAHFVGKAGEATAAYATSVASLAGERLADASAFGLLAIEPGVAVRVRVGASRDLEFLVPHGSALARSAGLPALSGSYTTHLGTGYTLTLTFDASGQVAGSDTNGCRLDGRAAVARDGLRAFDLVLDVSACGAGDGRYTGQVALLANGAGGVGEILFSASNAERALGWRLAR